MLILLSVALGLCFLLCAAVAMAAFLMIRQAIKSCFVLYENLNSRNSELTNLVASKDIETFRNLQALTGTYSETIQTPTSAFSEANLVPLDDVSIARRMAEQYEKQGMEASRAFATDPMEDFGGFGVMLP